jgi:hypothetical protein
MPNHELYIARGGLAAERWTSAYLRPFANAACLVAFACELARMDGYVGTY